MSRFLLASLAGAAILMIWGVVYWALSPLGFYVMRGMPDEAVVSVLSDTLRPEGQGVYFYPWAATGEVDGGGEAGVEAFYEQHRRGPLVQIFYRPEGAEPMSAGVFVAGFVHFLASAAVVAALLFMTRSALPTYGRRVLFVTLVGVFAGVAVELGKPIWFYWPWDYQLFQAFFPITGWFLAGLAMAAILKPERVLVTTRRPAAAGAAIEPG